MHRYFYFRFDERLYHFTHMLLGLTTAPRVCTQLLSAVNFALVQAGVRDIRYLDDSFLIGGSRAAILRRCAQSLNLYPVTQEFHVKKHRDRIFMSVLHASHRFLQQRAASH